MNRQQSSFFSNASESEIEFFILYLILILIVLNTIYSHWYTAEDTTNSRILLILELLIALL